MVAENASLLMMLLSAAAVCCSVLWLVGGVAVRASDGKSHEKPRSGDLPWHWPPAEPASLHTPTLPPPGTRRPRESWGTIRSTQTSSHQPVFAEITSPSLSNTPDRYLLIYHPAFPAVSTTYYIFYVALHICSKLSIS